MKQILITYFSYSGETRRAAEKLFKEFDDSYYDTHLFAITPTIPYTSADVNWQDKNSRNVKEQKDPVSRPAVEALPDVDNINELWIGYPIWWYTHPRIINTVLDGIKDKLGETKVHLFATSGGSGINGSYEELKKTYPEIDFVDARMM